MWKAITQLLGAKKATQPHDILQGQSSILSAMTSFHKPEIGMGKEKYQCDSVLNTTLNLENTISYTKDLNNYKLSLN